jgi:hypothetical protein
MRRSAQQADSFGLLQAGRPGERMLKDDAA